MARPLEFSGSNVEKAATAASKKLNISRDELKYQVLSYGSSGIFGLVGVKKAKIQILLPAEHKEGEKKTRTEKIKEKLSAKLSREKQKESKADDPPSIPIVRGDKEKTDEVGVDLKQLGSELLKRITDLISEDAKIEVDEKPEGLLYKIESSKAAVLIGKRGQTLEAMQYLVEKIINKNSNKRVHVQVDVEGYLEKRQESLQSLSSRMAEKAVRTKKPVTIGQMSAYERRVVHLALKDDSRIRTQSKGEGFLRKLVIFPVRKANTRKDTRKGKTS